MTLIANGRGGLATSDDFSHLAAGTMLSRDLAAARRLYEDFFGLECAELEPGHWLLRDRRSKYLMEQGERDFFVIDVRQVDRIDNPQRNLNHWGFSVASREEVERIHAIAKAEAEAYGIKKVMAITNLHGSYGFYLIDRDDNWWEVEYRNGMTNDGFLSGGDHDRPTLDPAMRSDPPLPLAPTASRVVGPEAFMTHGTTDVIDADRARLFYERILGLRSVRHAPVAQFTAGGGDFAIVGVQTGKMNKSQTTDNRWVLLVEDEARMNAIREAALAARDELGLGVITDPRNDADGFPSFTICSADDNHFEVSTRPREMLSAPFGR